MLALLSVFWSGRGITNAKNVVEDLDCCPKARPAAKISAVLSSKKGTSRSGSWLLIRKLGTDGKDIRIARGLKAVNAQPEKPLHVSLLQIAVGPATVANILFYDAGAVYYITELVVSFFQDIWQTPNQLLRAVYSDMQIH